MIITYQTLCRVNVRYYLRTLVIARGIKHQKLFEKIRLLYSCYVQTRKLTVDVIKRALHALHDCSETSDKI